MLSFAPPLPLLHRHFAVRKTARRSQTLLTADPPTRAAPQTTPSPPSPLQPPPVVLSTALTASLYSIISRSQPPSSLRLPPSATWHTPLFDLTASEIPALLTSFLSFAISPTLTVYSVDTNAFSWVLSFNYPLPWRPRVQIAGTTTTDSLSHPTRITDEWFVHPITLVAQALPRLPDILWLYPGPHAERDDGLRRTLKRTRGYRVERFSARAEMRMQGRVEEFEEELMFATPALPEEAFEGGLRRREEYAAVSPIAVRELGGGRCEWAVPVPSEMTGSGPRLLPAPGGEGVGVEVVGERVMAVRRFGGLAMRGVVEERVAEVLQALERDGVTVGRERVWVRVYDCKVGFNGRGLLAMAMYGSSTGVPRRNEIAVDVTGLVGEEFCGG